MGISAILWIGVAFLALMDASFNICMEPFRALVGDVLPKKQGTIGFSVQTILIGMGAILGSFLPWIPTNWFGGPTQPPKAWSLQCGLVFLCRGFFADATILYTIATVREYSPEEYKQFRKSEGTDNKEVKKGLLASIVQDAGSMPVRMRRLGWVQIFSGLACSTMWVYTTSAVATHHFGLSRSPFGKEL